MNALPWLWRSVRPHATPGFDGVAVTNLGTCHPLPSRYRWREGFRRRHFEQRLMVTVGETPEELINQIGLTGGDQCARIGSGLPPSSDVSGAR